MKNGSVISIDVFQPVLTGFFTSVHLYLKPFSLSKHRDH